MIVFAREVFVCKCPTLPWPGASAERMAVAPPPEESGEVAEADRPADGAARSSRSLLETVQFSRGDLGDLERLDGRYHGPEDIEQMRGRLSRGDYWLLGQSGGAIVTYTWLLAGKYATYPSLPGCEIRLRDDCGYGYDAWTPPKWRGGGLRRMAFREELRILRREWGLTWEASFFVKHQLEGATRSLARVGIPITPLWRIYLASDRTLRAERLTDDDDTAVPTFAVDGGQWAAHGATSRDHV